MDWTTTHQELVTTATLSGCVLLSVIIYVYINFLGPYFGKVKLFNLIPGPKTIPIIGNAHILAGTPEEGFKNFDKLCDEYRDSGMFRFWVGIHRLLFIYSAEAAEVILSSTKYIDKSKDYHYFHPWLGTGLLTSTGAKWRTRRKLLTSAFHFKIITSSLDVFNEQASKLVSKLSQSENQNKLDMLTFIARCALDIIHETALGVSINAQDDSSTSYVKAVGRMGALIHTRLIRPWARVNLFYYLSGLAKEERSCIEILHKQSCSAIEKKEFFKNGLFGKIENKNNLHFLDLLMKESLSNEDIREEVDTFMFRGHDTVSKAMWFCLYLLARHPEKQKLVHEELDYVFGNSKRHVKMKDLHQLKYLECCIKESLRLYPSVPVIARHLNDSVWLNGYLIPKGTTVAISVYYLHRNEKYHKEPNVFRPERFQDGIEIPFSYIPFSAGPRNCIGQKFGMTEAKVVLSHILRGFRVTTSWKKDRLPISGKVILRTTEFVDVNVHSRKAV